MKYTTVTTAKENNPRWLGSDAGYHSIHQFLKRNYGNPKNCAQCGTKGLKLKSGRWNIHWALLHGEVHGHDINKYIGLCYRCHGKYDLTEEKKDHLRLMTEKSNNLPVLKQLERNKKRSLIAKSKNKDKHGRFTKTST